MTQFVQVEAATGRVICSIGRADSIEFSGPPEPCPLPHDGTVYYSWQGTISFAAPTPTAVLKWNATAPAWIEEGEQSALIATALDRSKADVNEVTALAIGNLVNEYTVAAIDARAFAATGYMGPTTSYVSSYARDNETNVEQSNEWAARVIIARADAFESAQEQMRAKRFNFQRAMRNSTTPADLAHVVYEWDQFITGLRAQLGL